MWSKKLLQRICQSPEPVVLGSGEAYGTPFLIASLRKGGVPFTGTQKRQTMVEALCGGRSGLEHQVAHLLRTPGVQVRRFAAVYEVNSSVR